MKTIAIAPFLLLSIVSAWVLQGCGKSENYTIVIEFPEPVEEYKKETEQLLVYAIISGGAEATCQNLIDATAQPDDTNYTVKDSEPISNPFTGTIRPLKVPKQNISTLLFFVQGEDSNNNVNLRGCTEVKAGGASEVLISLSPVLISISPKPIGRGMIIPAYLSLADVANWNIIKESAATIKAGSNPTYKDFFIVVNGDQNGPFTNAGDWATAASLWDPIRTNGGSIFGYVHTCVELTGPDFRPLVDVEADITAWVTGYSNLDGIWLDQFYPWFEIALTNAAYATFPNTESLAPTDRSFLNQDNSFNGNQVNPTGGYYDQLTKWIRATYPKLNIVGNAGGWFYSNQINYADLVDVTCSFEQTYDYAENSQTDDWKGLNRQNTTTTKGQLALIHTNTSDLSGAIDQAISHGYTHFYTTNLTINDNLWGSLPTYFTSEVDYIANHP